MKTRKLLLASVWLFAPAVWAQQNTPSPASGNAKAQESEQETLTQVITDPKGGTRTVEFVKEKIEWSEKYHGYLVSLRAKEESPAIITLIEWKEASPVPPAKEVKSKDLFSTVDLHTDIQVTGVLSDKQGGQVLEYWGKFGLCLIPDFNSPDNKQKLIMMAGSPGTRLDISRLLQRKERLAYLGRYWEPTNDKEAIVQITQDAVEVLNVKVTPIK